MVLNLFVFCCVRVLFYVYGLQVVLCYWFTFTLVCVDFLVCFMFVSSLLWDVVVVACL